MNYYGNIYYDDSNPDTINVHISIIEGVYEINLTQKARVIGSVNITTNSFCKLVKQPYNAVYIGHNTIKIGTGLRQITYTLLSDLLTTEGKSPEQIEEITTAINNISNNKQIKPAYNWIQL
jgi:hypothetical protein